MKNESKVKFFKNKDRNREEKNQNYVPNYKEQDIQPFEYKSALLPENQPKVVPSPINPREKRVAIRQPYANPQGPLIGRGQQILPNVGNSVEQVWSGVDGQIIDAEDLDLNQEMIDNNDFVEHSSNFTLESSTSDFEDSTSNELINVLEDLEETSYLLIVKSSPICSGPKKDIEDQVQALVTGVHVLCGGDPFSPEDIMIFKKLSVKICTIEE